jgi:hypothetical protein
MQRWLLRTPEFRISIALISSPLAMIVSLWGMTSRTLTQMHSNGPALVQKQLLDPTETNKGRSHVRAQA